MGRAYAMYASRGRLTMEERTDRWMDGWMDANFNRRFIFKKETNNRRNDLPEIPE